MLKRINCEEFQESETLCMYMTCNFGMQHGLQFVSQRLLVRGIFVQGQTLLIEFKVDFCSTNLAKDYFLSFLSDIYIKINLINNSFRIFKKYIKYIFYIYIKILIYSNMFLCLNTIFFTLLQIFNN